MTPDKKSKLCLRRQRKQPALSLNPSFTRCSESKDHQQPIFAGLSNLGNTCYCNAVLQALRYSPGVSLAAERQQNVCDEKPMISVFNKLIQDLDGSTNVVSPWNLLHLLRQSGLFAEGVQHDAQELLNHLLADGLTSQPQPISEGMPSEAPKTACGKYLVTSEPSAITALFQGKLVFQTRCFDCDHFTRRTEPFLHVTLPVTSHGLPGFPSTYPQPNCSSSAATVSLSWCLSKFMSRERLAGDNKFWCERCMHLVEAERSIFFSQLPSILTVHLNRFSVQQWGKAVGKVANSVAVPMTLCLRPWSSKDCLASGSVYQLHAVVLHTGTSCHSGHYTALIRDAEQWLHCDDDIVTVVSRAVMQELLSPLPMTLASPYILFYSLS